MLKRVMFWAPAYKRWRASWGKKLASPWVRIWAHLDMDWVDHGVLRFGFSNVHQLATDVYRSNQPSPRQMRGWAKRGIKTVVNLRGENNFGSYHLEKEVCEQLGLELIDFKLYSRRLPKREEIHAAREIFLNLEKPALLHCKSGADRAGLGSALYLMLVENVPVEEAQKQLSWRFLHIKHAKTGLLDHFLDSYRRFNAEQPTAFLEWVDHHYDRDRLAREFHSRGWANAIVDGLLNRE